MAVLKRRLQRKNSGGDYDIVYFETSATVVKMVNGKSLEETITTVNSNITQLQADVKEGQSAKTDLDAHIKNTNNPHSVTCDQIKAVPVTRTVNTHPLSADVVLTAADVGADPTGTASSAITTHLAASNPHKITCDLISAVPTSRTINTKALTGNITLNAADVNAVPTTRTVNNKALSADITLTPTDVNAVPTTRTVNSKALSADIVLSASDVGADPAGTAATEAGKVNTALTTHTSAKNNPHNVTLSQIGAQKLHGHVQISIGVDQWTEQGSDTKTYTYTCSSGITCAANDTLIICPDPSSADVYGTANCLATAQAANSVTFTCKSKPTDTIKINVAIFAV